MANIGLAQRLPLPGRALALVLAGGRVASGGARSGARSGDGSCDGTGEGTGEGTGDETGASTPLQPAPPAHFGGKFRTVDFALSNCLNSGVRRIVVLTPSSGHSLQRHLARSWSFLKGDESEFVKTMGTQLGAAAGHRDLITHSGAEFVIVLNGDRIYKMNCAALLADHVAKGRTCTVACMDAPPGSPGGPATVTVDAQGRITGCAAGQSGQPAQSAAPGRRMHNLGICVFSTPYLLAEFDHHSGAAAAGDACWDGGVHGGFAHFVQRAMARAVHSGAASAHHFSGSCVGATAGSAPYWCDVSQLDAYWHAHIDLTARAPQLDLYDPNWPMRAQHAELAPAKFLHNEAERRGMAVESLVSGGSIISGSVLRSVLFSSVRVHSYARVEWSVLLPAVQVGRYARLHRVVVDSACSIPDGLVVGEDPVADAARFFRSDDGITFVTADRLARVPSAAQTVPGRARPCATS